MSAIPPSFAPSNPPRQPIPHGLNVSALAHGSVAPAGTFAPGTKVQVGGSRVVVEKYLSEGGFAHVYVVKLPKPIGGDDKAVLKRVAVPDKEALANMRTEVETMKKLKGHRKIVTYFDSHASQLQGGGYEVFLLMEYCSGGGLIDFMNTRLQNRLTEPEILKILCDTAEGVACMHYLKPPLVHRDLKVENILISDSGSTRTYKLCDFGSSAPPRPAATTAAEGRLIEDDVQRHTTMQYRSPEMIDVYRKQPIDEKSDIWALGVLLYKLCYYTTPFEEQGQMAILNASFKYPGYPPFSDRLKKLIAMMLQEKPQNRPNVYQVLLEVCAMRGKEIPIKDIYTGRTASDTRRNQELPSPGNVSSPPIVGAYKVAPIEEKVSLPEITPMRRGRPTEGLGTDQPKPKPSPSPRRIVSSDPFAALDSESTSAVELDMSSRFPSLDQFSLLHDSGNTFAFENKKPQPSPPKDITQRVTEALADEAFAMPAPIKNDVHLHSKSVPALANRNNVATQTSMHSPVSSRQETPAKKSSMTSTGTMTSPPMLTRDDRTGSPYQTPIFRFPPSDKRSSSQPRAIRISQQKSSNTDKDFLSRPVLQNQRSSSQTNLSTHKTSISTRPSLESERPHSSDLEDVHGRSRSVRSKRPVSAHLETAAKFLTRSPSRGNPGDNIINQEPTVTLEAGQDGGETSRISSNVEFLKAMEGEEPTKKREKRMSSSSKHSKRSSMPSISLSGTKSLLVGRFGEAFRRFESNTSPYPGEDGFPNSATLTPIDGSTATDGRSDDGHILEETEETSPEVRRELERRRLSQEERRVADGAAAYKQRIAASGDGSSKPHAHGNDNNRAARIQNKVQALLDESTKVIKTKTAEGYGRFTNSPVPVINEISVPATASTARPSPAARQQQPPPPSLQSSTSLPSRSPVPAIQPIPSTTTSASTLNRRPSAPPKPRTLRTGAGMAPVVATKPGNLASTKSSALPRTSNQSASTTTGNTTLPVTGAASSEDWEASFSKRYPTLSGLEMVETEIESGGGGGGGGVRGSESRTASGGVGYRDI